MKGFLSNSKKILSFILTTVLLTGFFPFIGNADSNISPVRADKTDFDVFMNVDPSYGIEANTLSEKIKGYLNSLIQNSGENKTYRFNTITTEIDPTDLTKWNVYDHYDTLWYPNEADWREHYNGRGDTSTPESWYYAGVSELYTSVNGPETKRTIEELLSGNGTFGKAAKLREHMHTYLENNKPAMQFYGYSTLGFSDFLYYPATSTSEKTVKYDIDSSNVEPHSLKYSGFLINAGTNGEGTSKTINGYLLAISYGPLNASAGTKADQITSIELFKLNAVNVNDLRTKGLKQSRTNSLLPGASLVTSSSAKPFYNKSHLEMNITGNHLKTTVQQLNSSNELIGSATTIFDCDLSPTDFGGFGPYVDYGANTSHSCQTVSSFRFSNLEMSFKETMAGFSPLEAYQFSDYLKDSNNRFFINLTNQNSSNYDPIGSESDLDKAYIKQIQDQQTIFITDKGNPSKNTIFPERYLNLNSKNVFDSTDVSNDNIANLYTGSNETEILAAKLAWLIYNTTWQNSDDEVSAVPQNAVIASLKLMDGTSDDAVQVNYIYKNYIDTSLKVYIDSSKSVNVTSSETPHYVLTKPDKTTTDLTLDENGTFSVDKSWVPGDYSVTLSYTSTVSDKVIIPDTTTFTVFKDGVVPTASIVINSLSAQCNIVNTEDDDSYGFTSPLHGYAYTITDSSVKPVEPSSFITLTNSGIVTIENLGYNLTSGTHYLHMFLKDAAGNIGHVSQSFNINAPSITFTDNIDEYSQNNPYLQKNIRVSPIKGSYDISSVKVSNDGGISWETVENPINDIYTLNLKSGEYTVMFKSIDIAGNESATISLPVNTKKYQTLSGTNLYNLELGIDNSINLDYSVSDNNLQTGESLGNISYTILSNPENVLTLNENTLTINKTGEATITVTASETSSHYSTNDTITVNITNVPSVKLNASQNLDKTGITVNPQYIKGVYEAASEPVLKYRVQGTSEWTTIPNWSWDSPVTILYENLQDYVTYNILLEAKDTRPQTPTNVTASYSFHTPDIFPQITISDLPSGIKGESYSVSVSTTGTDPKIFSISEGTLPNGLTLNPETGVVSGIPTESGNFIFKVMAVNPAKNSATEEFNMFVANPPTILTNSLPGAVCGDNYFSLLEASGDTDIYWSLTEGNLPDGLVLNSETGIIDGKIKGHGSFTFTLTATNTAGSNNKTYNVFISNPPSILKQMKNRLMAVTQNDLVTLKIDAFGDSPLLFQWQINLGDKWENIEGATTESYSFKTSPDYNGARLRCKISNSVGTVISEETTMSVSKLEFNQIESPSSNFVPTGELDLSPMLIALCLISSVIFISFVNLERLKRFWKNLDLINKI